jgi:hypothetical protein
LHAAGQQVSDAQLRRDPCGRRISIPEQKCRVPGDHQEIAKARQVGDDVAGEAIAQVVVARIA